MLIPLAQVLNADEIGKILHILASAPPDQGWTDGRITTGSQSAMVKNNQQMPEQGASTAQARDLVLAALSRNAQFMTAALPRRVYPPSFNRYSGQTNAFGSHIDNAVRTVPGSAGYLRTDVSCTLFLNDPGSYDGGELVIQAPGGEQSYKLNAGDILLYPSTTLHRVNPVTRGERIASFFWVESMIRSAEQRQLLYQLDMGILSLRQKSGETPEAVRLTGVYHNLLRMWATV